MCYFATNFCGVLLPTFAALRCAVCCVALWCVALFGGTLRCCCPVQKTGAILYRRRLHGSPVQKQGSFLYGTG